MRQSDGLLLALVATREVVSGVRRFFQIVSILGILGASSFAKADGLTNDVRKLLEGIKSRFDERLSRNPDQGLIFLAWASKDFDEAFLNLRVPLEYKLRPPLTIEEKNKAHLLSVEIADRVEHGGKVTPAELIQLRNAGIWVNLPPQHTYPQGRFEILKSLSDSERQEAAELLLGMATEIEFRAYPQGKDARGRMPLAAAVVHLLREDLKIFSSHLKAPGPHGHLGNAEHATSSPKALPPSHETPKFSGDRTHKDRPNLSRVASNPRARRDLLPESNSLGDNRDEPPPFAPRSAPGCAKLLAIASVSTGGILAAGAIARYLWLYW